VTWIFSDDGYELRANRDEKFTRAPAAGPRTYGRAGVRFIAPTDGDFGGTWVGVNELGLSLCLLNRVGLPGQTSRGLLVLDLLSSVSIDDASARLLAADVSAYGPFTLAMIERRGRTAVFDWDGREIGARGEPRPPLVSSSFDPAGVQSTRRREFARLADTPAGLDARALESFHESHSDGASAYSPCMHRPDAETVSFSRVRVSMSEVEFYYTPAAPCRGVPGRTVRLPLRCDRNA
jgi:hypothetical protein